MSETDLPVEHCIACGKGIPYTLTIFRYPKQDEAYDLGYRYGEVSLYERSTAPNDPRLIQTTAGTICPDCAYPHLPTHEQEEVRRHQAAGETPFP